MPHWWYDRRSSRKVAEAISGLGLLAFLTANWTSIWFALTTASICFCLGIVVAARARAWSVFYSDLVLMTLVVFLALLAYSFAHSSWAPF
jgi:ABC-type Fe3+ transport system permease subunit